jgi:GH24 family phage-related lysozyme (muramidase)
VNGELVDFRQGMTQEQAEAVLTADAGWAKRHAVASLKKNGMENDEGKVEALTSLIYNVGSGAWGQSKAKKYLESGNVEDFMHEAFSEDVGFVKMNGEKMRGLVRRRAAEAELFAQANIREGGGGAPLMGSLSGTIVSTLKEIMPSFVSEAEAATPQAQALEEAKASMDRFEMAPRKPEAPARPEVVSPFGSPPVKPVPVTQEVSSGTELEGSALAGIIPSEFRMFASDILGFDDEKLGINYFGKDEQKAIKTVIGKAILRTRKAQGEDVKNGRVDYDTDWVSGQADVSMGSNKMFGGSELSVQRTLGDQTWVINDEGHVIVTDTYDFNEDKGALGTKADAMKKFGNVWDAAVKVKDGSLGLYGFVRQGIANSFGSSSADGKGSTFEFDLGPVEELLKGVGSQ